MNVRISNRPDKPLGTHPVNWLKLRSNSVRLARLPNSGGISPLNWFRLRPQPSQVGEVAQLRRYLPAQLVVARASSPLRLARLPNSGGISPLNWFPSEGQRCPGWRGCPTPAVSPRSTRSRSRSRLGQVGEAAQLRRYLPAQLVLAEGQLGQVGEAAQLRGYLPAQLVPAEGQPSQVGEVAQLRRYLPAQLVVAEATALSGWRGCPTPAVSPRSTAGYSRGSALAGWRGRPTTGVSPRSTRSR